MNRSVFEMAYRKVFGISLKDVKNPEHQKKIDSALEAVWMYPDCYPGETEAQRDIRLDMDEPARGEVSELAYHLQGISTFADIKVDNVFETIFEVYKRMIDKTADSVPVSQDTIAGGIEEVVESSENNLKEVPKMDQNVNIEGALDALNALNQTQVAEVKPEEVKADPMTLKFAAKKQQETRAERVKYTASARVQKVVLKQPSGMKRAKDHEKAMGIVQNPESAFNNFVAKFGVKTGENGELVFEKCFPGDEGAAKEMYNILLAAKNGAENPIAAHVTDSFGSIVGYDFAADQKAEAEPKTIEQMKTLLIEKSNLYFITPAQEVKVTLGESKSKASTDPTKAQKATKKSVYTVKVVGRSVLKDSDIVTYLFSINKTKTSMKPGFKSELCAKYFGNKKDAQGNPKAVNYRIPLLVEQYDTDVVDKYAVLNTSKKAAAEFDFANQQAIDEKMTELIAIGLTYGEGGADLTKWAKELNEQKGAEAEAAAAKFDV